jgi:hypothetical protein
MPWFALGLLVVLVVYAVENRGKLPAQRSRELLRHLPSPHPLPPLHLSNPSRLRRRILP